MKKLTAALGVLAFFAAVGSASAASITWNLNAEFSGSQTPENTVTVLLEDVVGGVRVTMSLSNIAGTSDDGEFVSAVFLNYTGGSGLTFTRQDANAVTVNSATYSLDAYKADGDGFFDINFDFAPPPGGPANIFNPGESVVYLLSGTGVDVSDFNALSAPAPGGGAGPFPVAARVQGIGPGSDNSGSGWVTIPEPSGALLFGVGTLLAGAAIRRRS